MEFNDFRNLMKEFESILETFVGTNDREDLSNKIRIKLSPTYENILFEFNECFVVNVSKESSGYFIDVILTKVSSRMRELHECELFMKVLDGKIVEICKQVSK